jgi:hypothetical protein
MNGIYFTLAILCCAAFSLLYSQALFHNNIKTMCVTIPFGILMVIFAFLGSAL